MKNKRVRQGPKTLIPDDAERRMFKVCRDESGSCREVGNVFGVTGTTICNIENGKTDPNLLNAFKFALYFKQPLEVLFPDVYHEAQKQISPFINVHS